MGYYTEFDGQLRIDPPLNTAEVDYLNDFFTTEHPNTTTGMLAGSARWPKPGIWCDLKATTTSLAWNGSKKTYDLEVWVAWVIDHMLSARARPIVTAHLNNDPRLAAFTCDHVVNGLMTARGEDAEDRWALLVRDNVVETSQATSLYAHQVPITREQAESWAGRPLDDHDLNRLRKAIPHSSIPAAIEEIVAGFDSSS